MLALQAIKHCPEVSPDVVGGRLKVRLRMAALIFAQVGSPSSFLTIACKSCLVLTLDLVLGQVPSNPAPQGAQSPWGRFWKTRGDSCLQD